MNKSGLLMILILLIFGISCDSSFHVAEDNVDEIAYILTPPEPGDVYVAGTVDDNAMLWKNGVEQYLTDDTINAAALSVYVSAADVYTAGKIGSKAVLWKNGIMQILSDDGVSNSVFVTGSDVFVAGSIGNCAVLWKNGDVQNLTDGALYGAAKSIYVSGSDVYMVGDERTEKDYYSEECFATVWKNGVEQQFFDDKNSVKANSIFVSDDGCVYVAGGKGGAAIIWKDGVAQHLAGGAVKTGASANSVFVSGDDVYVAGSYTSMGNMPMSYCRIWINGENILPEGMDGGYAESSSHSVYVSGEDVYMVGSAVPHSAIFWKNGERNLLTKGNNSYATTRAYSVFVVK